MIRNNGFTAGAAAGCQKRPHQFVIVPGFQNEVMSAASDGFDGRLDVTVSGEEHNRQTGIEVADRLEPLESLHSAGGIAGEIHIQQDHVVGEVTKALRDEFRSQFRVDAVEVQLQKHRKARQDVRIVIDDENGSLVNRHSSTPGGGDHRWLVNRRAR